VVFALELFDVSSAAIVDRVDVETSSGEVVYKEARASFLRSKRYPHRNGYAGGACLSRWPAHDYTILQPMHGLKLNPGDKFALMGFFEVRANAPSELTIDRFTIHFVDGSTFVHSTDRGTKAKLEVVKSKTDTLVCNGGASTFVS
jgi:hypothetical protein